MSILCLWYLIHGWKSCSNRMQNDAGYKTRKEGEKRTGRGRGRRTGREKRRCSAIREERQTILFVHRNHHINANMLIEFPTMSSEIESGKRSNNDAQFIKVVKSNLMFHHSYKNGQELYKLKLDF